MVFLAINDLVKNFNGITALDNVSLNIEKGDFFGLLGPNGAGKSTLMNCIVGYIKPNKGEIIFDGVKLDQNILYKYKIGYVPQEIALYQELTAIQNLKIFGGLFNLTKKELYTRIDNALELVQLTERKNDILKNFSGGMKRRLNIAASVLHDPDLILCDEPTVGVDPQSRNAIFDMLLQLNTDGKTIIYTTHYMEEAERLCNKLAIIDYGKIIANGDLNELIQSVGERNSIIIRKSNELDGKVEQLKKIGSITETDFNYSILPVEEISVKEIMQEIDDLNIPLNLIEITSPSLEDVFLNLTGRSLRD